MSSINVHNKISTLAFIGLRAQSLAKWAFMLLMLGLCYLALQNLKEERQWAMYAKEYNCYISSISDDRRGLDERGGRLATNPAPKEWSCDNGLKFKRY